MEESSPQQEVVTNKTEIKSTPNETGESSTAQEVFTNKTEIKLVENGGRGQSLQNNRKFKLGPHR